MMNYDEGSCICSMVSVSCLW